MLKLTSLRRPSRQPAGGPTPIQPVHNLPRTSCHSAIVKPKTPTDPLKGRHVRAEILVRGIVQGVGFRPFVHRLASKLNLSGTVRNLGDAGVEIAVEGPKRDVDKFVKLLPEEKPPLSEIHSLEVRYAEPKNLRGFKILESKEGGTGSGTIPPDTAICDECLADVLNSQSRYYGYWATSCVNCGPRFTIMKRLPYDRRNTTMADFPMCEKCTKEYDDIGSRRHHAQTIACPKCGPRLFSHPPSGDPIRAAAQVIKNGGIVAIKGIGGAHLACDARDDEVVTKLKRRLGRPYKPLAVMAKDIKMVEEFAILGESEKKLLKSLRRPIVVVDQRQDSPLSPEIAHGLHNVGVMLPYSGLHFLLFQYLDFPVVMTSANMPGKPILVNNEEILSKLRGIADFFLLHNRKIAARCDDSVVRFSGGARRFLRRSRSWAPSPIRMDLKSEPILALGAEFDNTVAIFSEGNCYISQHIGDVDDLETLNFLREAIEHLTRITNVETPDTIACDLHPGFLTTRLAEEMSEAPVRVQHHHAHIASVLGETQIDEAIGIAIDGIGYGEDGTIWGGEVLLATRSNFERIGGLSEMLMPGGDLATRYPARMIAGIFHDDDDLHEILLQHARFPRGLREQEVVEQQLKSRINTPVTTSAGRFLDAISAMLGACYERTYEGEPAMKLESLAFRGKPLDVEPEITVEKNRRVLDVKSLARRLLELKESGEKREDIAATAQDCLARGLARIAIEEAVDRGIEVVALSGGVAYNDAIGSRIREEIKKSGLKFITNELVPCGDGGISFGQTVVAAARTA